MLNIGMKLNHWQLSFRDSAQKEIRIKYLTFKKKQLRQQNAMLTNSDLIKSLSTRVWKVVTPPAITE